MVYHNDNDDHEIIARNVSTALKYSIMEQSDSENFEFKVYRIQVYHYINKNVHRTSIWSRKV